MFANDISDHGLTQNIQTVHRIHIKKTQLKNEQNSKLENRVVDTPGEGEDGMYWESSIETYTLPYVKLDSQWRFSVWCREFNSSALRQTRGVGWGGRGEGGSSGRGHTYTSVWFMLMYGRNQDNIVKQLSFN